MAILRRVLERLDLTLNPTRTKVVDALADYFEFLGFSFQLRQSRKSGKIYPHTEPSKRSVQRLKDWVKKITDRRRCPVSLNAIVNGLNATLRGWTGYFYYRNSSKVFRNVKMQAEERLRTHLRRRHKLQGRAAAYKRFPNHRLYERYDLFKLPTTAGWKKAHAI